MPAPAATLPARWPELILRPIGDHGQYVVKNPRTGSYYQLGEHESFLLERLDGTSTGDSLRAAFEERFGQPLTEDDLQEFLDLVRTRGFLLSVNAEDQNGSDQPADQPIPANGNTALHPSMVPADKPAAAQPPSGQSLLYWRIRLFDPDRLLNWLLPKIAFFWTRTFVVLSLGFILLAAGLLCANAHGLITSFRYALRWETLALVWLTLLTMTTCHEFAHGLTCKRYGGEVHEVGILFLFLMPCLYCNVSDAWLLREKSKRLWITLAGGYCDLCVSALAAFVWRATLQDSFVNYLAYILLSVCGARILLNLNPLIKLDGYYLLSDLLDMPNLQQRASDYLMSHCRWLFWGAPQPTADPRGRLLLGYGIASWLFCLGFLSVTVFALVQFLTERWGLVGLVLTLILGVMVFRSLFRGFFGSELQQMFRSRQGRTAFWLSALGALVVILLTVRMEDRAGGAFQVRSVVLAEIRSPVAGFLREVYADEGDRISSNTLVARMEVPNLASRIVQKQAEIREMKAKLRLLEVGPRPEEVAVQRLRVERAQAWHDLAERDLGRAMKILQEDLARLERQVFQQRLEYRNARDAQVRAGKLLALRALSEEEHQEIEKRSEICRAQLEQAEAQQRARQALGTQEAETELVRRGKELSEAKAALALLEARSRPEELDAAQAHLGRLEEEIRSLEELQDRSLVLSPVSGLLTTPRLREKIGHYFREGELICLVEEPSGLEAEIALSDQELGRVRPGQPVELKVRTRPFTPLPTTVERIAPKALRGEVQSTVIVYCRLDTVDAELRPGMTGYAHIHTGQRRIANILTERILHFLRTDLW